MNREDEALCRDIAQSLLRDLPPTSEQLARLLQLARDLDAVLSDLKQDSDSYQRGTLEERREWLRMLRQINYLFEYIQPNAAHLCHEQAWQLLRKYLQPVRDKRRWPVVSGTTDAHVQCQLRRESLFGDMCLTEICMRLRMGVNGSADQWAPADIAQTMELLGATLAVWRPSIPQYEAVDNAVRRLVEATLEEVRSSRWWQLQTDPVREDRIHAHGV